MASRRQMGEVGRISNTLRVMRATPLQCRMAWILYAVRGELAALTFLKQIVAARAT